MSTSGGPAGGAFRPLVIGGPTGAAAGADSALLLVGNLNNSKVDTIGKLGQISTTTSGGFPLMIPSDDIAALFDDGWVALIRNTPYRVEWRSPDGAVAVGPVLSRPEEWNEEDQGLYLSRRFRLVGVEAIDAKEISGWPKARPSFMSGWSPAALTMPDGKLLVQRMPESTRPGTNYDVIDRKGVRVAILSLRENQFLIASGRKAVYVSTIDESGIQRVGRHPWP